jgi:hypothetical protein
VSSETLRVERCASTFATTTMQVEAVILSRWLPIVAHLPARRDDPAAAHKDEKLSCASADVGGDDNQREPTPSRSRPNYAWRDLMRRAFGIDPLLCPRCATPMKLVAVIESPCAIRAA